jgi:hypothetical protein
LICVRVCRRSIACRSRLLHTHSSGPNTPRGNVRQTNSPQRACDHCPTKHRCLRMTPGAQPPPCSDHTAASPWWRPTWSFFCKRWIAQKGPCNPDIHFFARHGGPSQTHSRCSGEPERIAQPQRSLTESHFHRGHTSVTAPLPATLMSNVLVNIDRVVCVRCTAHTHTHAHAVHVPRARGCRLGTLPGSWLSPHNSCATHTCVLHFHCTVLVVHRSVPLHRVAGCCRPAIMGTTHHLHTHVPHTLPSSLSSRAIPRTHRFGLLCSRETCSFCPQHLVCVSFTNALASAFGVVLCSCIIAHPLTSCTCVYTSRG